MNPPLLKPQQISGKITLTPKQRARKRLKLYRDQGARCAECGGWMIWESGFMNSATLDHITPQPAGCAKDDRDENLRLICWKDNYEKGSKRQ